MTQEHHENAFKQAPTHGRVGRMVNMQPCFHSYNKEETLSDLDQNA